MLSVLLLLHCLTTDLQVDVHGDHCSNANSVRFLSHIGFNSLSCDPYRVPIAEIAAAQAKIHYDSRKSALVWLRHLTPLTSIIPHYLSVIFCRCHRRM